MEGFGPYLQQLACQSQPCVAFLSFAVYAKEHENAKRAVAMHQDKIQILETTLAGMEQLLGAFIVKKPAESTVFQQTERCKFSPALSSMIHSLLSSMHRGTSLGQSLSLQNQLYFAPVVCSP
uniref:Uncharacterized protein MANES_16G101900 n=2 Tax=Rhizophora mucronata TaxID=61149 RepID=A0A2P2MPS3_RHIMU